MMRLAVVGLLLMVVGAAVAVVKRDVATDVLQHIVNRIVHRYEDEEQHRRVCGTEFIAAPSHRLLTPGGSNMSSLNIEAPVCCPGYERNSTTLKCVPKCRGGCHNGRCVAPGACVCLLKIIGSPPENCTPPCPKKCLNGIYYGDICVCDPGFTKQRQICVPQCRGDCRGGNCTAPNVCVCSRAGYVVNEKGDCEPFCQGGCVNAKCSAPNVCTCWNGYKKHPGHGANPNYCVPDCFNRCVHGECTGPGKCACYPGYTNSEQKFVCEPDCQPRCVNGTCTSPGVCTCKPGYVKRNYDGGSHVCVPASGGGSTGGGACRNCTNGRCTGGQCLCYDGYYKNITTDRCVPRCSISCAHGTCSAPDVCTCDPGYVFDFYRKKCLLSCSPPCQRGTCADGNTCKCNPGYAMDSTDWTGRRCLPLCDPFCVNGVCSSPNQCICKAGFVKDTSSGYNHICMPRSGRGANVMTTRSYG